LKIYLDNCCFNRPYDDQSQLRISLEAQAKLFIQNLIRMGKVDLVSSYILTYENGKNPYQMRNRAISEFLVKYSKEKIDIDMAQRIKEKAQEIMKTGVKAKDSLHVACAIEAGCEYFLSTDDRLLKYRTSEICMINPVDFIKKWEEV